MIFRSSQCVGLLSVAFATVFASPAWAQSPESDGWQFSATPYLWLINIEGDAVIKGNKVDIDTNIFDIIDESDSFFALQGHFEARKRKIGAFLDLTYMDVGMDAEVGPADADIDTTVTLVELGGFYRVAERPLGAESAGASSKNVALDLLAGGRYTSMESDLDINIGPAAGSFSGSQDWIDPFVGARATMDLTDRLVLVTRADIGGFGVGSDFTWHALGLLGYRFELFGARATALGGYRALYQDFEDGDGASEFGWDTTIHGPILGLNFQF
jgi:hypothetical protein